MKKNDGLKRLIQGKTDYKKMIKSVVFSLFFSSIIFAGLAVMDYYKEKMAKLNFNVGRYVGAIPLSENKKIGVFLVLESDYTFILKEQLVDPTAKKKPDALVYAGSWSLDPTSKQIILKQNRKALITTFSIVTKDTILMHRMDLQGQEKIGNSYKLSHRKWYQSAAF
ncbi:copper resistance protein NlpE N-terminal domain-containing protein [Pedobacter nototheniae]|uniref:copper resistance protein NlpE N-terminal domain-containing protein n=1 Tax=Pedobacter nototheniae TaxID=2488994 RepID=UPI00292E5337|nr:copper resistance protein NlpE N-terminal domain-containing protein [Pedobacter nototheniae]